MGREYERMATEQNNLCAICGRPEPQQRNSHLALDHCHKTGIIRKLLCSRCNRVIGFLREDLDLVKEIENYIRQYKK